MSNDDLSLADVEQMIGPTYQVTHSCDVSDTSPELRVEWGVRRISDGITVHVWSEKWARDFVINAERSQDWVLVRHLVYEWEEVPTWK